MKTNRIVVSISIPPKMDRELKKIMKKEEMSRSEIIRNALRLYVKQTQKKNRR